jgi:hypothetical protein
MFVSTISRVIIALSAKNKRRKRSLKKLWLDVIVF